MRKPRILGYGATVLLSVVTVLSSVRVARAEIVDRVVAVVEDEAIFLSDIERRIRPMEPALAQLPNARQRAERRHELYVQTVENMVDDALLRRAAQRAHISVASEDVDRMIEGIARERNVSVSQLYEAVQHEGLTRDEFRSFMESRVLRLRVLNVRVRGRVNITEQDIVEEYRRRVRQAEAGAPFRAAHIFFAFPENPNAEQIADTRRRAEDASRRARAGESFAQLARDLSDDGATQEQGGELGEIDPSDENTPPFLIAGVQSLPPGGVSSAVRGANGYHVFRLISRDSPAVPPLGTVRDEVYTLLLNQEMERQQRIYLRELRQRTSVVVRLEQ